MKRKIISTILATVGLIIIGFAILFFLGMFKEQVAGVLIEADPISKVYINNKEVGVTPYEADLKSGEISVKIKPNPIEGLILDDYETKINLVPGIRTIIKRTFKPNEENSSGVIVSFEKIGGDNSFVTVVSVPDNAQILIDGKIYGYSPIKINIPAGDHVLVVSSNRYLDKSLPIKVYKGYKLTASVKLARLEDPIFTEEPVLATEISAKMRVKINKTDIGFLRVRSGPGKNFPEVTQVKPDEEYDVLEEDEYASWYKIKVGELEGWVSAEFVTKIYIPLTDTPE